MRKAFVALAIVCASLLALGASALTRARTGAEAPAAVSAADLAIAPQYREVVEDGFDVDVWVGGRPLEEYVARGKRYVEALDGAEYELRVRNPLGVRVAVALSVDGMNTIDARRTTAMNASKWVIEPYQTITIKGWQMSSARARRFYFTTERDSYGAKIGQTANLGNISAVFFRERQPVVIAPPPRYPISSDERGRDNKSEQAPQTSRESSRVESRGSADSAAGATSSRRAPRPDDDYAATGIGRNVQNDVRWVNLELQPSPVAEVVIRYEYRDALVRLGILPRPYPPPDTLHRREDSTGFDGRRYSPEP